MTAALDVECWQYLIKQEKARTEPTVVIGNSVRPSVLKLDRATAERFIVEFEWLGNIGSARYLYGLFYGPYLAAAVCFAKHTSRAAFTSQIGVDGQHVFQLSRGASAHWAPKNSSSRLVSRALRMLHQEKGAKLVVAYADPEAGEVGIIYQAANALYLGLTDSRGPGKYIINGVAYHPRSVHRKFGSARHLDLIKVDPNYVRKQRTKKHKYVFVVGRSAKETEDLLRSIGTLIKPFPKRRFTVPAY